MKKLLVLSVLSFTVLATGCDSSFILNGEALDSDNLIPILLNLL